MPDLEPRQNLRDRLHEGIRQRIVLGQLPPDISVGETALAGEFNVSRTPVREALLGLERDGFVKAIPGRGFVVAPLSADEARQFYPILWTLEGLAVRSGRLDRSRLKELQSLNARLGQVSSIEERVTLDSQWHRMLVGASGNPALERMVDGIRFSVYRYEYAYLTSHDPSHRSCDEHAHITDLFVSDPEAAAVALEQHWKDGLTGLLGMLEGDA